jgi:hypothetical protein
MAQDVQITCIKKSDRSNPHERIHGIGGTNADGTRWYLLESNAIAGVRDGKWRFWTTGGGKSVWVVVATHEGHDYLKTESDGIYPNNLLALSECP